MTAPNRTSPTSPAAKPGRGRARRMVLAVLAYGSAVSASVGAAAALATAGVPIVEALIVSV